MGNIKTCIDTTRICSDADKDILDERFDLVDKAHEYLYDTESGTFRNMEEAIKIAELKQKK